MSYTFVGLDIFSGYMKMSIRKYIMHTQLIKTGGGVTTENLINENTHPQHDTKQCNDQSP